MTADANRSVLVPLDAAALAEMVVSRDRWRIRLLASLAVIFWVLAAVGVLGMVWSHLVLVLPRLNAMNLHPDRFRGPENAQVWVTVSLWAAGLVAAVVVLSLLAAVCTVGLVLLTRRATLRQVQAGLADVAAELRQLRDRPAAADS
jgi:hypothetical protein